MNVLDAAIRNLAEKGASELVQLENMVAGLGLGCDSSLGSAMTQTYPLEAVQPLERDDRRVSRVLRNAARSARMSTAMAIATAYIGELDLAPVVRAISCLLLDR